MNFSEAVICCEHKGCEMPEMRTVGRLSTIVSTLNAMRKGGWYIENDTVRCPKHVVAYKKERMEKRREEFRLKRGVA